MAKLQLTDGNVECTVLPAAGGRIQRLRVFGHDVLRATDDKRVLAAEPYLWGAYVMVPWCNRVPGGHLVFDQERYQLPVDFEGHAIHGRCVQRAWTVTADDRIEIFDGGDAGHPWPYRAWQEFDISANTLRIAVGVENAGSRRMPAGLGIHPWFDAKDPLEVRLPAEQCYPSSDSYPIHGAAPVPVEGDRDLRRPAVPAWGLDETWTGLTEHRVDLRWPTRGISAVWRFTANCDHVVLAAIEPFAAVAIEPQTHASDGHRRLEAGERGAIGVLEPGERLVVTYDLDFRHE